MNAGVSRPKHEGAVVASCVQLSRIRGTAPLETSGLTILKPQNRDILFMTPEIMTVLAVLLVTVVLIVTEALRIDVVAILAMLSLVWLNTIEPAQALSGFSSNAIIAIIAVMILGRGLFRSGITDHIARFILNVAGTARRRIVATISLTVGGMSGFMQNLGAAALFLPVMVGISKREKIPVASLLMPMGFAALLGGTITMVGTSSLIVLNDLLEAGGRETFNLFSVTPIGIALLLSGILFLISGLIPIGIAMKETGTASFLAENIMNLISGSPTFIILLVIGALTTIFSLFMSNVAATVLLVPIVLEIATNLNLDPRAIVLLVGVCAANSFVIPTHHVNALLMTPGGYKVKDYLKAGSGLSVLFLLVSVSVIYFFYLP